MDNFCPYCGHALVNGQCNCVDFLTAHGMYIPPQPVEKDPIIMPFTKINISSFSGFISSLREITGTTEKYSDAKDPYERNVLIVPDCIEPEDNEVIVKQYNIAKLRTRLKFMRAEGRMQVTNRRLLFRAAGTSLTGNILQEHQFNLDDIAGLEIHKDYKFSLLNFFGTFFVEALALAFMLLLLAPLNEYVVGFVGFFFGIIGMVPTFILYKRFWLKLFCSIISYSSMALAWSAADGNRFIGFLVFITAVVLLVNLIIVCFVPNLVIKIKAKGGHPAVVIGSQKPIFQRQTGDDYCGFAEVLPWDDTVMAINELGTIIDDLQKLGDYAIEKWSK